MLKTYLSRILLPPERPFIRTCLDYYEEVQWRESYIGEGVWLVSAEWVVSVGEPERHFKIYENTLAINLVRGEGLCE